MIPYGKQNIDEEDIKAVVATLRSEYLTQGPTVSKFEQCLCEYTGAKYCVAVANGTAALHLSVAALGLDNGLEGITSPITFMATSNALAYNGLIPRFVDIDARTYLIDTDAIEKAISPRTRILLPVHFAGQPVDIEAVHTIAKDYNIYVIEDAAHAIGSRYADGTKVGNCRYSDMTIFSFHPVKTITTGEGGAITTNSQKYYEWLLELRSHGITRSPAKLSSNPGPWYHEMQTLGFNYRITDIQAALGISQLTKLDFFIARRREIVKKYNAAFKSIRVLTIPYECSEVYSGFHLYVIKFDFEKIAKTRAQVMEHLSKKGIGTQVHYIPVHLQPYYQCHFGYRIGDFPNAENYYSKALSLPLYPTLTEEEQEFVISSIIEIAHEG
jgi:UDP-4-amino-4,6-dideoxy-N-acetyl-beta-L-altrosamine transaminase